MSRLNWNKRQGPGDFDDTAPAAPSYEFDYTRNNTPGSDSWPARHGTMKFGPSLIRNALASGLCVYAVVEGFPYPVMVKEAQWDGQALMVVTLEGPRAPERLFTRTTAKGLTSSGLLIEKDGD